MEYKNTTQKHYLKTLPETWPEFSKPIAGSEMKILYKDYSLISYLGMFLFIILNAEEQQCDQIANFFFFLTLIQGRLREKKKSI